MRPRCIVVGLGIFVLAQLFSLRPAAPPSSTPWLRKSSVRPCWVAFGIVYRTCLSCAGLSHSSCRTITLHERVLCSLVTLVLDFSLTGVQDLLVQVHPPNYSFEFAAKTVCLSTAFRESDLLLPFLSGVGVCYAVRVTLRENMRLPA